MRKLGRLWSRFKYDPDDAREPPWDVFSYWVWASELERAKELPSLKARLAAYQYDKENADMPF